MIKKYWNAGNIFTKILVPLTAAVIYCVSFAYLSSQLEMTGVNSVFVNNLGKYLLLGLMGVYILFFIAMKVDKSIRWELPGSLRGVTPFDLLLIFLPLTPIVQYLIMNQESLTLIDVVSVILFFALITVLYTLVFPMLLSPISSFQVLQAIGLTFVYTIVNMSILSNSHSWLEKGSLRFQLPIVIAVFLLALLLGSLKNRWILYTVILAFFASNTAMLLFTQRYSPVDAAVDEDYKLIQAVQGRQPVNRPNVYLLTYDAYVPKETLLNYEIDNSKQEDLLVEQGFKIYPHTYTLYADTLRSMGSVLNAANKLDKNLRITVSGDGRVIRLFKDLGYETYGIFPNDFMFGGHTPTYDAFTPGYSDPMYTKLITGVLLGEFRFDIGFNDQPHEDFLIAKESLLKQASGKPSFVYMHTDYPSHSQRSGACQPDETGLFQQRLAKANQEMRHDIQNVIENDPDALIIINGDHGPYLTKNCAVLRDVYDISQVDRADLQDRYASFLAIRWPSGDFTRFDDITVLQDIFPAVFAYLYDEPSLLETKVDPVIGQFNVTSGATVKNGKIVGGMNDSEPLFLSK